LLASWNTDAQPGGGCLPRESAVERAAHLMMSARRSAELQQAL